MGRKEGGGTLERKGTEGKKVKRKKWGRERGIPHDTEGRTARSIRIGAREGHRGSPDGMGGVWEERILNPAEGQKNADT